MDGRNADDESRTEAACPRATGVVFTIPLSSAHALLAEEVFARGTTAGHEEPGFDFQDSNSGDETHIRCSVPMARFILKELQRLGARAQYDVVLSFALTEAAVSVRRAMVAHDTRSSE